ncbi:myoneurin [Culicoides brevitarsis]|uniref:myoneurin n=1 Tax=Culicoides brevitarsis TaxID=469753 RepID=UPI00307C4D63
MTFSRPESKNKSEIAGKQESAISEIKQKYECRFCHERFRNKDALDRHVYHHTNERKFICSFEGCSSSYTNVAHLRRHVKRVHVDKVQNQSVDCIDADCAGTFSSIENMRRHFREVHQKVNYVCNNCSQSFRRKQQLKRHIILHTGEYPYQCEVCKKGSINLKAHIRHRASHIHNCDTCGRVFKNWSGLVAHRKISHVKEFKCEVCNKVFISQKNLNYHKKVHLSHDERSVFQCTYDTCAKYYYEKRNLMAHIRSKHEGRKFICGFENCGRQISTKQKLVLHLKLHLFETMGSKEQLNSKRKILKCSQQKQKQRRKKIVPAVSVLTGINLYSNVGNTLINKSNEVSSDVSEAKILKS